MCEGKGRKLFVLLCKPGKPGDHIHQLLLHQTERLRHHNDIRVVAHIAGCGAQMNDPCRLRTLQAVSIDMTHHIMPHFLLPLPGHLIVDILRMGLQLVDLFLCDDRLTVLAQSQLHFRLRQRDPKFTPRTKFHIR